MKIFKKILSGALLLSALLVMIASCENNGDKDENDNTDPPAGINISGYRIVRSDTTSDEVAKFVTTFKKEIVRYTKADLTICDDYLSSGESADGVKEILIGETDRAESISALASLEKAPDNAYTIRTTEDKIVIAAKNDAALIRAMKYFLTTYAAPSSNDNYIVLEVGKVDNGKVNLGSIVFDNFAELEMLSTSSVYTPANKYDSDATLQYPTIVQLCHNGENNGVLLSTFQSAEGFFRIYRSRDDGKTWQKISEVSKDDVNEGYDPDWAPFLYELPCDMGDFPKGTVLLAANSKDSVSNTDFTVSTITLYASTDLGESWKAFCNVDVAGGIGWGVWEPFLIYEEERGRLYCFYSDDSDPDHDQKLVYKYTTDLKTWVGKDGNTGVDSDPKEAVACTDPNLRPGMISISKMNNGEYFVTFELDNMAYGYGKTPIYAKTVRDLDNWGDASDYGEMVVTTDGKVLGTSPWCAWTPAGGECGTLVLVARWRHAGSSLSSCDTDMFISLDYGKTFIAIKNPITYTNRENSQCGYSPALIFSQDGSTLYYLNNPLYGIGKSYEMILAKIKIR